MQRFVTADEAKWVYRSARFLAAFLQGDFAATSVNLTPAVTTTWLGSLGLAGYYWLHRAAIEVSLVDWLLSLPPFRVELEVLAAVRWPMVLLTSLGVVALYLLLRRLFNPTLALLAAVFIALDPHLVSLSRILGHDAPATLFVTLSLLLLLALVGMDRRGRAEAEGGAARRRAWLYLLLSGFAAGLAFLSKAPALFLLPFAGLLFLARMWRRRSGPPTWLAHLAAWAAVAYLTFVLVWPAAWVEPLGRPLAVVENAFLSATDQEEADAEGYWLVPDLGPTYYLVNGAFKLSPLVMIGSVLALGFLGRRRRGAGRPSADPKSASRPDSTPSPSGLPTFQSANLAALFWLLAFSLLFTIFMTFGDKRSPRYILPVFPPLAVVAAAGWLWLYQGVTGNGQPTNEATSSRPAAANISPSGGRSLPGERLTDHGSRFRPRATLPAFITLLALSALIILLPYGPYYFTYYNPLLGGPFTAPNWVKIGWGEGLDQVGRFLQREDFRDSRVGTAYASTVAPFFEGDLSDVTGERLDYLVLYTKQVQAGDPSPTFLRYFDLLAPVFSVDLNGIHYADVYPGPALQPSLALRPGLDHAILPKPIGFRPLTPYGPIGRSLTVDVVWLADDPLPTGPSMATLKPLAAFDFLGEDNDEHGAVRVSRDIAALARGAGHMVRVADQLVVSRHELPLPDDLERGRYALLVDERPLGEVELRHFQVPADLQPVEGVVFGEQIVLAAYQFNPNADYIGLTLAWQAQTSRLPDYTVFVQLLDSETNERVAGFDTQPLKGAWPTSRWAKGEVVVDEYLVAVPPDVQPGLYKVIAGLYRPETGRRLTLPDGRDHWLLPWTFMWEE